MSECQSWGTPPAFIKYVENTFGVNFTLDAAANEHNAKAPVWIDEEADSLTQQWRGVVWLNPPFGHGGKNVKQFIQRAVDMKYMCGSIWVLIPARTDTRMFHELVIPNASAIYFIKGRLNHTHPTKVKGANATFPSMLVEFRPTLPVWPARITTLEPSPTERGN